jgi:parallel beta-helix repeat protein
VIKTVSGIILAILLVGIFATVPNTPLVEAGILSIYIKADGSLDPPTPLIQRNGDLYTLTGNIRIALDNDGIVIERDNVTFDGGGYTVNGTRLLSHARGICLSRRSNVTVKDVKVDSFYYGICLDNSSNINIFGNDVTNNSEGIELCGSSNNSVSGNKMTNNDNGIVLFYSSNNIIDRNDITDNSGGVLLLKSPHCSIVGNSITENNHDGICFASSSNNSIVENNIAENNGNGIHLDSSSDNNISGNSITENTESGIVLWDNSNFNNILGNDIKTNKACGIVLSGTAGVYGSSNCIISENNVVANEEGISLSGSSKNSIVKNNLAENLFSFKFTNSWNNFIYHNNLLNNTNQVFALESANVWDNGVEGNYWSGHAIGDLNKDGICDCPYTSCKNNTDNCPLISPYMLGDVNHDSKVNIVDINLVGKAFRTQRGDENWNPHADIDENGVINAADITVAAKEFGKEWKYP